MTKIQVRFRLARRLDDAMMERLARAHTIYGIQGIQVAPSLDGLTVEFDATRLLRSEVEAALAGAGIPVAAAEV